MIVFVIPYTEAITKKQKKQNEKKMMPGPNPGKKILHIQKNVNSRMKIDVFFLILIIF